MSAGLKDVREGLSQLIHQCMEEGIKPTNNVDSGFDVVQKLSLLLDNLDASLDTLRTSGMISPESPKNAVQEALAATDLNRIPDASPFAETNNGEHGASFSPAVLSPEASGFGNTKPAGGRKRQSVSFLPDNSPMASPKLRDGSPKADGTAEGQVEGWISRTYSGYGSFRRQSRAALVEQDMELQGVKEEALGFNEFGMPALDLAGKADPRNTFSRPVGRHTAVFAEDSSHLFDEVSGFFDFEVPELVDIDDAEFDVFTLLSDPQSPLRGDRAGAQARVADNRRVFIIVAANVFLRYSFVTTYQLRIDKFSCFVKELSQMFSPTAPFSNALHAAAMLQAVHVYFCQQNVKENFQDVELFATLFAAMCCQVGNLGVNNEFLARIDHPLVRLFTDTCPQENFSAALAFKLLSTEECNFLDTEPWRSDPLHHLTFKEVASDAMLKTASRYHLQHIAAMEEVIENGVVKDIDVPVVLSAVVRVADCHYCCLPEDVYLRWVGHFVEESYQQGDEEAKRGIEVSALCDRNEEASGQGTKVKAQIAFLRHVVQPLLKSMGPVLPEAWLSRLQANLDSHGGQPSPRNSFILQSPQSLRSDEDITTAQPPKGNWVDHSPETLATLLSSVVSSAVSAGTGSSAGAGVGAEEAAKREAYQNFSLLRMFLTHWTNNPMPSAKSDEDFIGHVIQLAIKLDPSAVGPKALDILKAGGAANADQPASLSFEEAARLGYIVAQEPLPSNFSFMTESNPDASNPYLVLLLLSHEQMVRSSTVAMTAAVSSPSRSEGRREADTRNTSVGNFSNVSGGTTTSSAGRWLGPVENSIYRRQ